MAVEEYKPFHWRTLRGYPLSATDFEYMAQCNASNNPNQPNYIHVMYTYSTSSFVSNIRQLEYYYNVKFIW